MIGSDMREKQVEKHIDLCVNTDKAGKFFQHTILCCKLIKTNLLNLFI